MSLRTMFLACMALAALALYVAASRGEPAQAPAEPEGFVLPHYKWTVRKRDGDPVIQARAARAVVPAAAVESVVRGDSLPRRVAAVARARRARRAPRVRCHRPHTLRLVRYEDGSARLMCSGRVLVRVSVPG